MNILRKLLENIKPYVALILMFSILTYMSIATFIINIPYFIFKHTRLYRRHMQYNEKIIKIADCARTMFDDLLKSAKDKYDGTEYSPNEKTFSISISDAKEFILKKANEYEMSSSEIRRMLRSFDEHVEGLDRISICPCSNTLHLIEVLYGSFYTFLMDYKEIFDISWH